MTIKIKDPNHQDLQWLLPETELNEKDMDALLEMNFHNHLTDLYYDPCDVLEFLAILNPTNYPALALTKRFCQIATHLIDTNREAFLQRIKQNNYRLFRLAVENDHLDVLRFLVDQAPEHLEAMIKANDYGAFCCAAENGHLDVLRFLIDLAPEHLESMIKANDYEAFRMAAKKGHLDVLRFLIEQAPGHLEAMIEAENYHAFYLAAWNGHLDVLRFLIDQAPEHREAMIKANDYYAFYLAAEEGHLDVACFLVQCGSDVRMKDCDVTLLNHCLKILNNDQEEASKELLAMQSGLFLVCHGARYQNIECPGNNLLERLVNTLTTLDEQKSQQCLDYIKNAVNQIPPLRSDIKKGLPHFVKTTVNVLFWSRKKHQEMKKYLPKPLLQEIALTSQPQHVLAQGGFDRFQLLNKEAIEEIIESAMQLHANTPSLTNTY